MSDEIKYFYLHDPKIKNRGGEKRMVSARVLTVARKLGKNGNKIHYQVALCTPVMKWIPDGALVNPRGDAYSKQLGRTIATGRLKSKPFKAAISDTSDLDGSPLRAVLVNISENKEVPQTARRMVKNFLKSFDYKTYVKSTEKADTGPQKPLLIEVWQNDGNGKQVKSFEVSAQDNLIQVSHTETKDEKPLGFVTVPTDRVAF